MKKYFFYYQDNGVPCKFRCTAESESDAQNKFWAQFSPVELLKIVLCEINSCVI
jgi:hypothetical protein